MLEQQLHNYLRQQIASNRTVLQRYLVDNQNGKLPARPIVDTIYASIDDYINGRTQNNRWIVMPGLRGVGKTTVLAQLYSRLANSKFNLNLLYLSLDQCMELFQTNLSHVLKTYEDILAINWVNTEQLTIVFLDEVQVAEKWFRHLKFIYDQTDKVFFVCSGSSATGLQMDADTAGRRASIKKIAPLSFKEYQLIYHNKPLDLQLSQDLKQIIYNANSAKSLHAKLKALAPEINNLRRTYNFNTLDHYLDAGSLPGATTKRPLAEFYQSLQKIVDKIIYTDLKYIKKFNLDTLAKIKMLLFLLADSNDTITFNKLNDILQINSAQLWAIFNALIEAELLIKAPAIGNSLSSARKPAKYNFMSPALRASYYDFSGNPATVKTRRGRLLEDAVALHFYQEFTDSPRLSRSVDLHYHYDKKQPNQADFILQFFNSHRIAIEIGLGQKNTKQVLQTMQAIDCRYGLVFANSPLSLDADNEIVVVPLEYFLAM